MLEMQNEINRVSDRKSQNMQILEYLKAGYSLTALEALTRFKCMRLGA